MAEAAAVVVSRVTEGAQLPVMSSQARPRVGSAAGPVSWLENRGSVC